MFNYMDKCTNGTSGYGLFFRLKDVPTAHNNRIMIIFAPENNQTARHNDDYSTTLYNFDTGEHGSTPLPRHRLGAAMAHTEARSQGRHPLVVDGVGGRPPESGVEPDGICQILGVKKRTDGTNSDCRCREKNNGNG